MKRKILDSLREWRTKNGRMPLVLNGARQVGKTYILEEFGKQYYTNIVRFNLEADTRARAVFEDDLNPQNIIMQLESISSQRIVPHETLLILDEIQASERALTALKSFCEQASEYHVCAAGSMLGVAIHRENYSFPVGKVEELQLFPLDFEEFLWAMGNEVMMPYIRERFEKRQPMGEFHREALHYFRQYLIVGGMPQAVVEYAASPDFTKVDAVKRQILRLYKNDIKKYAGGATARVSAIYDAIPGQLQKKEKKFMLSALKDEARMREYDSAFFWLEDSKMVNISYNTTAPNIGLQLNEDRTTLKCYYCDTGLLISLAFSARGIVTNEIYQKLMFDKLEIDEGMLVENIVAQMLKAAGHELFFYSNYDKEEAENRMQVDFLVQKEVVTSRHNISPIEVKSGTGYTLTSIQKCIKKFGQYLSTPYVLHTKDVEHKDGLVYLPLYMTGML